MKKALIILIFLTIKSYGQDSLVWTTGNEVGVVSYDVQQSIDTNNWVNLEKVMPLKKDSNVYAYSLTQPNYYYRIKSNMISSVYTTSPDLLTSVLPVELTNIAIQNRILNFTSNNENNLQYYIIYESIDGINFVETNRVIPKGNSNYSIQLK